MVFLSFFERVLKTLQGVFFLALQWNKSPWVGPQSLLYTEPDFSSNGQGLQLIDFSWAGRRVDARDLIDDRVLVAFVRAQVPHEQEVDPVSTQLRIIDSHAFVERLF